MAPTHLRQAHVLAHVVRQEDHVSLGGQDHQEALQDAQEHAGLLQDLLPPLPGSCGVLQGSGSHGQSEFRRVHVCFSQKVQTVQNHLTQTDLVLLNNTDPDASEHLQSNFNHRKSGPQQRQAGVDVHATFEERVCSYVAEGEADDRRLVQVLSDRRMKRQQARQVCKDVRLHPAPLPGGLAAACPAEVRGQRGLHLQVNQHLRRRMSGSQC